MDNRPSDPGTAGTYTVNPSNTNGFVKGAIIAYDLDSSGGGSGGISGNNVKIWYDGALAGGLPITNSESKSPPRYASPTVWLAK